MSVTAKSPSTVERANEILTDEALAFVQRHAQRIRAAVHRSLLRHGGAL